MRSENFKKSHLINNMYDKPTISPDLPSTPFLPGNPGAPIGP